MKKVLQLLKLPFIEKSTGTNFVLSSLFKFFRIMISSIDLLILKNMLENPESFKFWFTIWLLTQFSDSLFINLRQLCNIKYKTRMFEIYRVKIVKSILNMDFKDYINSDSGTIYSAADKSLSVMINGVNNAVSMVSTVINLVTQLIVIFTISKYSGLVIFVSLPIFAILCKRYGKLMREFHDSYVGLASKLLGRLDLIVNSFSLIRAKNSADTELKIIDSTSKAISDNAIARSNSSIKIDICIDIYFSSLVASIILLNVLVLHSTAVTILTLVSYISKIVNPIAEMIELVDVLSESVVNMDKYFAIENIKPSIKEGEVNVKKFKNNIAIKNVSFKYNDGDMVLNNISLNIKKGQKIGICGTSGGGKSSLVYLLNRFYDVTKGSIEIDGINIKDLNYKSLRKLISYVSQQNIIFNGTIRENIMYGLHCTEMEMVEAARKANAYDFITKLENGFDTKVGAKGLKLSGGQQQRIAIARAFLQNSPIVILDEATSALDNESERVVQNALDNLSKDKTTITIAHRLTTIKNSDKIIVLDNHEIAEQGTHDELIQLCGIYASLNK